MCKFGCDKIGRSVYMYGTHVCEHNSLAVNYPAIARQWHPTKNGYINPIYVTSKSNKDRYWFCDICGYDWEAKVSNRTRDGGCPKCNGRYTETVDKTHPHLLEECHPDDRWKLYKYTAGSSCEYIRWKCKICMYFWMATLNARTNISKTGHGTGCPQCAGMYTETVDKTHPHLLGECHEDDKWKLYQFTAGSGEKIKWKCKTCTYIWWAALRSRSNANRATGCPQCAGKNDKFVDETHAYLIEEWHEDNYWNPNQLKAGSKYLIKWKCRNIHYHIWWASVDSRAGKGTGCPKCKRSIGEGACERILKQKNVIYDTQYHIIQLPTRAYDFIFIYNNIIFLLEFDGIQHFEINERFHQNDPTIFFGNQQTDRDKTWVAISAGYKIIRVSYKTLSEGSLEWHLNEAVRILTTTNQTHYFSHPQDYQYLL